nr:calcium-binding protein [Chthonobacter rhizosphaerae]
MAADRIEVAVGSEPSLTAITAAGSNSLIVAWESDPGVISTQKLQIRTSDDITTRVSQAVSSGTGGSDSLIGTALNNDLSGLAGHDILEGGLGNDRLMGGAGSDLLVGGAGQDEAVYWQATAGVVADLTDFALNTGEAAGDRYVSIERLGGSNHRDSLRGDAAANVLSGHSGNDDLFGRGGADRLDGGVGNDTLVGGDGADHLIGGSGTDTASYAGASKAVTANLGKSSLNTNEAKGDVYAGVENLLGSSHSDTLTGDAGSNWLYGGGGNDTMSGGSGNDRLVGGAGRDKLAGGSGRDAFVFDTKLASSNIDRITDFSVKEDALWLDDDVFKNIGKVAGLAPAAFHVGTKAHDRTDRVIYNKTTGGLYFDPDGTGSAKAILFAELGAGLALSAKNIAVTA